MLTNVVHAMPGNTSSTRQLYAIQDLTSRAPQHSLHCAQKWRNRYCHDECQHQTNVIYRILFMLNHPLVISSHWKACIKCVSERACTGKIHVSIYDLITCPGPTRLVAKATSSPPCEFDWYHAGDQCGGQQSDQPALRIHVNLATKTSQRRNHKEGSALECCP